MNSIIRNILAVVIGIIVGSFVNMSIISVSNSLIPLPEGIDPTNMQSLKDNIQLFQPQNFIMPFLAHALGTLVGAFVAVIIAASHHIRLALMIGVVFMIGGVMMVMELPNAPIWFNILDIVGAYIPMGWLGYFIAKKFK